MRSPPPGFDWPWEDAPDGAQIWAPQLARAMALGAVALGVPAGLLGWLVADGALAIRGLGQWAASGEAPATVAAAAVGVALGGLIGGIAAMLRLPAPAHPARPAADGSHVRVLVDGLLAGLLAALAYWLLDTGIAGFSHGRPLEPSRYMASVVLGPTALFATEAGRVLLYGWLGHLIASLPWGFVLSVAARRWPRILAGPSARVLTGMLFGIVVWAVNLHMVARIFDLDWLTAHDALTMWLVHLVFGLAAAVWVGRRVSELDLHSST